MAELRAFCRPQQPARGDLRQDRHSHRKEHPADADLQRRERVQQPYVMRLAYQQEAEHCRGAQQVGGDQDALAVVAVREHAGQGTGEEGAQHADREQGAQGGSGPGELRQQRRRGDDVEPVAEKAGDLREPQQPKRPAAAQQFPVAAAFFHGL